MILRPFKVRCDTCGDVTTSATIGDHCGKMTSPDEATCRGSYHLARKQTPQEELLVAAEDFVNLPILSTYDDWKRARERLLAAIDACKIKQAM